MLVEDMQPGDRRAGDESSRASPPPSAVECERDLRERGAGPVGGCRHDPARGRIADGVYGLSITQVSPQGAPAGDPGRPSVWRKYIFWKKKKKKKKNTSRAARRPSCSASRRSKLSSTSSISAVGGHPPPRSQHPPVLDVAAQPHLQHGDGVRTRAGLWPGHRSRRHLPRRGSRARHLACAGGCRTFRRWPRGRWRPDQQPARTAFFVR